MRANKLTNFIEFYRVTYDGPEPGVGHSDKIAGAYAEIYEPSAKDVQLGNLETSKTNITVIIRNSYPEFVPQVNETFKVVTGLYSGMTFDIKTVTPIDNSFIKIVGESNVT